MFTDNMQDILSNNYIKNKLNTLYPEIDINNIDTDLLNDMISNIINEDYKHINKLKNEMESNINNISENQNYNKNNSKFKTSLVEQNIMLANEIIPEMSIQSNLIYLTGKINGFDTKILVDTGASSCIIFKSTVDKCNLSHLIDTSTTVMVQGAHGMKPTLGTIWFMDLDLKISNSSNSDEHWVSIPISTEVIDDSEIIKTKKIMNEYENKITNILGVSNKNTNKDTDISHGFELILGMTFLKSYRVNIDFSSMTIKLNNSIDIKFK